MLGDVDRTYPFKIIHKRPQAKVDGSSLYYYCPFPYNNLCVKTDLSRDELRMKNEEIPTRPSPVTSVLRSESKKNSVSPYENN